MTFKELIQALKKHFTEKVFEYPGEILFYEYNQEPTEV